jgi:hypothetical protein
MIDKGFNRLTDTWIRYETEDYDLLLTINAAYNNGDAECPVAFKLDSANFVVNRSIYKKSNLKKTFYDELEDSANSYYALSVHVDIYKHGTTERIDIPEVYQSLRDIDQAQSFRCLNESFVAKELLVANKKEFNKNNDDNKRVNRITDSGDIYSDYSEDPAEELNSPNTANLYRKDEKLRSEGLDMVYAFRHTDTSSVNFSIPEHTVTFKASKGGKVSLTEEAVLYGKSVQEKIKVSEEQNYKFTRWITDQDVMVGDKKIKAGETITMDQIQQIAVTGDMSFTARFKFQKKK